MYYDVTVRTFLLRCSSCKNFIKIFICCLYMKPILKNNFCVLWRNSANLSLESRKKSRKISSWRDIWNRLIKKKFMYCDVTDLSLELLVLVLEGGQLPVPLVHGGDALLQGRRQPRVLLLLLLRLALPLLARHVAVGSLQRLIKNTWVQQGKYVGSTGKNMWVQQKKICVFNRKNIWV